MATVVRLSHHLRGTMVIVGGKMARGRGISSSSLSSSSSSCNFWLQQRVVSLMMRTTSQQNRSSSRGFASAVGIGRLRRIIGSQRGGGGSGDGGNNGRSWRIPILGGTAATLVWSVVVIGDDRHEEARKDHENKSEERPSDQYLITEVIPVALGVGIIFHVIRLFMIFMPLFPVYILFMLRLIRPKTLHHCLSSTFVWAGPTFIKLGQWMATRPDVFSLELCTHLGMLHADAPYHSFEHTEATLKRELTIERLDEIFESFDPKPLHSGCMAQIHRARLHKFIVEENNMAIQHEIDAKLRQKRRQMSIWQQVMSVVMAPSTKAEGGGGQASKDANKPEPLNQDVAVKILHPGVERRVSWDLAFMRYAATFVDGLPGCQWFGIRTAVENFADTLLQHLDMTVEGTHLRNFNQLFANDPRIKFPKPYMQLATPSVLIESFEPGELISDWIPKASPKERKQIARMGLRAFLQMVFHHNYVHADLHPGNILVERRPDGSLRLVFVDTGMVTILTETQWVNFVELYACVVSGDASTAARIMRERAPRCDCTDPQGFESAMSNVIREYNEAGSIGNIHIGSTLNQILSTVFRYKVGIESSFSSLVVSIIIMEGLARRLDSDLDLVTASQPYVIEWLTRHPSAVKHVIPILRGNRNQVLTAPRYP